VTNEGGFTFKVVTLFQDKISRRLLNHGNHLWRFIQNQFQRKERK